MSVSEKVYLFNEANFQVAKKLNHQRNVGKKRDKEKSKANLDKLNTLKASYKEDKERFTKQIEFYKNQLRELSNKKLKVEEKKLLKQSYNDKIEKATIKLEKSKERLENFKRIIEMKEKCENIALSTSKANYIDPRIGISFCKRFDIPIEKIYNSSMQKKFEWALDVEDDYFEKFARIDN
jgi:DNA topoisomerase-1